MGQPKSKMENALGRVCSTCNHPCHATQHCVISIPAINYFYRVDPDGFCLKCGHPCHHDLDDHSSEQDSRVCRVFTKQVLDGESEGKKTRFRFRYKDERCLCKLCDCGTWELREIRKSCLCPCCHCSSCSQKSGNWTTMNPFRCCCPSVLEEEQHRSTYNSIQ